MTTTYRYVNNKGEELTLTVPYEKYDPAVGGHVPPPIITMTFENEPDFYTWISAPPEDVPDDLVTEPELPEAP